MRLDFEWARALKKGATPGDSAALGSELDLTLFFQETGVFRIDFSSAFFFPGAAFDLKEGFQGSLENRGADFAARFTGRVIWFF